ncbi:MAG: uroporphyrinogen decarboxylase family protein [Bacillota bacterium]
MKSRDRVMAAIKGTKPGRPPRGEFWLGDDLVRGLLEIQGPVGREARGDALASLGFDLVAVACVPAPGVPVSPGVFQEIEAWSAGTDFFVFAQVGGCFSDIMWAVGWKEFLTRMKEDPGSLARASRDWCLGQAEVVSMAARSGASGILIGDDLAYAHGTFVSPEDLRRLFLPNLGPVLEAAERQGLPVMLHSDGNINGILPDLVALGIHGIHSLDPDSGMSLAGVKRDYGKQITLMGNVSTHVLATGTPEEIRRHTLDAIRAGAPGGRYILASSGGFLDGEVSVENLVEMYRTADEAGRDPWE